MKAITEIFRRLRVKVSSLILAILVLGFGILVILNISRETELLVAENLTTARLLATTIKISVDNGMLEARPDIISGLVRNLKSELKDVRRLEVYRRNGVEAFSDLDTLNEVHTILGLDPDLYARIAKMGRVVLRPIAHVVGAARQIGSGNFAARVAVRNQDEIGQLGQAINDMAGRLSSAHENL